MAQALSANMLQLETSEEKYRTLVTSMRDGIYQTDKEGLITFLNPAGVDILGFGSIEQAFSSNMRNMFIEPIDFDPATWARGSTAAAVQFSISDGTVRLSDP